MSSQSTRYLTRKEAESVWVQRQLDQIETTLKLAVRHFEDGYLEDELEDHFTNYIIKGEGLGY